MRTRTLLCSFMKSAEGALHLRLPHHIPLASTCSTPDMGAEEFRLSVESRIEESARHRKRLNAVYAEQLEAWAAPAQCRDWRFTLFCDCQQDLLRAIFGAGHFASAHFDSLAPMFGPGVVPVADLCGKRVVNLFNDFRYDAERAGHLAKIVRTFLEDHPAHSHAAINDFVCRGKSMKEAF